MLPELVVQAGAPDVILELDGARSDIAAGNRKGSIREGRVVVELHVEELALYRPAVAHRVFGAGTHGPTGAGIALQVSGRGGERAGKEFRRVDLGPRAAAGHVQERIGAKPPEVGQADPRARGNKPTL